MASKLKLISELASETTREVTRDVDGWKRYLTTAAGSISMNLTSSS